MLTPGEILKKKEFQNKIKEVSDKIDGVKKSIDSIPSTYITKTDAINKFITNEALNPDTILTKESASNTYQVKGDYVTNSVLTTKLGEYQVKGNYLTSTNADSKYQVKGDYVDQSKYDNKMKTVDSDITDLKSFKDSASKVYQPKGNYLTSTNADSKYQVKGDYVTNSVLTTKLGEYQPKGEYATKSEIESSIKLKAEKVHNHEVTDINGLDEKLSEIKLEDTAIDVIAEEKKLNVVLSELRNKDVEQSTEILNLKNELNGYVARHKVANDSIQKSIND